MSSVHPYVDVGHSVDHEILDMLPVVFTTDVTLANAGRMIDDKAYVQQTR